MAAWTVLALAVAVFIGWLLDIAALKAPIPGLPSMKANTAVSFTLLAGSILLHGHRVRWLGVTAAAGAGLLGALTLAQYVGGVDLGIDEALVKDDVEAIATATPGRMSVLTAFCFVLASTAMMAARGRDSAGAREGLAAGIVFVATFVLGCYAYGAVVISGYTQVALHTALSFLLLGPAVILLRPEGLLARTLLSPHLDGLLARRLLPTAIVIPLALGWIRISLQDAGLIDTGTGAALFAATMVIVLVTLILLALRRLQGALVVVDAANARVVAQEARLRSVLESAPDATLVVDGAGRILMANGQAEALFGYTRAELTALDVEALVPEGVRSKHPALRESYLREARARPMGVGLDLKARRKDATLVDVEISLSPLRTESGLQVIAAIRDVTAQRRAEAALAASEDRLKQIFAASPSALILARRDGTVLDLNPAAEQLWGRPREHFFQPGFSMAQLYEDPSQRERVTSDLQARGRTEGLELRMRHGDGQVRTMSFNVVVLQHQGAPAFLAAGLDITDLRAAEQRFRLLFEASPVGTSLSLADGRILDVNAAFCRICGYTREDLLAPGFDALALYAAPAQRERLVSDLRATGKVPGREFLLRHKDGGERIVLGSFEIIDLAGQKTILGLFQDVTEARRAEKEAQRAQQRFATVFQLSPLAICLTKEDGSFVDVNAAFCDLVGRLPEDMVGGPVKAMDIWEDPQERQRMLLAIREHGVVRDLELRIKRPDGEVRTTLASIEFIDLGGGTTILSMLQDITDRLRVEEERAARAASEAELERLRRTDRFRAEFINNIAHELATPLTPLVLKAKALVADATLDAQQRTHVEAIERNVQRLRHLVDDMVGAADLQARNLALDKRRLNLTRELRAAVAAQQPAVERAGLRMDEPEDTGLTVSADPARLQLVMGHLLGNAIKFTPSGGRVTVTSRRTGTDEVRVEVHDTGVGLTRKQIEGLWRPFAQAHDKSQRTQSGSGLGLYVVKGIVELHGGEVGVSSPGPGQGSTFWFTLPLATGHLDPLSRPKAPEPGPAEPRRNLNPGVGSD